jgi:phosphoribosyl-AMP cyclohydrolase
MTQSSSTTPASEFFTRRGDTKAIEHGTQFQPKFDSDGLIGAIVTDAESGAVVMFAHMNAEALRLTLETGFAHFWSRSRAKLWKKGEDSGNLLRVAEIRTDCDQDVLLISAHIMGAGVACHTGAKSCFYRCLTKAPGVDGRIALESTAPQKTR